MWQQIIAYLIVILALAWTAIGIYRFVTKRGDPCGGCAGCGLKKELDKKLKNKK